MKSVLITAFEPFNKDDKNPTEEVLAELPDFLYNARIVKVTLPVVYNQAFDVLLPYIDEYKPDLILMMGLAAGRTHVNIERIAINVNDARIPDNLGNTIRNQVIVEGGPDGLFTNLPLEAIMKRMHKKELPVMISNTAGAYICNHIMYKTLHYIKTYDLKIKAGFVHMPYLPGQVLEKPTMPSMERRYMRETITTIIDVLLNPVPLDIKQ